ncbi:MAG: triose-phosphate isomerase [Bradymonadaceae bacterium]
MRTPIVASNWKMHKLVDESRELAGSVADASSDLSNIDLILSPTYVSLPAVAEALGDSSVGLAAQNVHWAEEGAYTGEVSPPMVRDVGCTHAIIGHSERRQYFGETDVSVNRRARAALDHDLRPIICVGESLAERRQGETELKIKLQIRAALSEVGADDASDVVLAYEPLWAIGTGESAEPDQVQSAHRRIRELLDDIYGESVASSVRLIYGGSVKPHNVDGLIELPDVDGALVGSASLEADSFLSIAESVSEHATSS